MLNGLAFFLKFKYHFGWKCLDLSALTSSCAFTTVIYNKDETYQIIWNRARNINSIPAMFPQSTTDIVRNWNMTINDWLTNYVFYRVMPPKPIQKLVGNEYNAKLLITRITSALFHGLYPGYYVFFAYTAVATNMVELFRNMLPTREDYINNENNKSKNNIMLFVTTIFWPLFVNLTVDTSGYFFIMLDIKEAIQFYISIYWFPFVFTSIGLMVGFALKPILRNRFKSSIKKIDNTKKKE